MAVEKAKGAYGWDWGEEGEQSCLGTPDGYRAPHMFSGILISLVLGVAGPVPSSPSSLFHLLQGDVQVSFFVYATTWKELESRTLECHRQ